MEQAESFKFLGILINNKLTWSKHTKTVVKMAQQNLFPLRRLKRFNMGLQILKWFNNCTIESTGCITAWYGNCSASDHKALQRVVRTAQYNHWGQATCHPGPLYQAVSEEGLNSNHPSHRLFSLLPHGKQYWSTKSRCDVEVRHWLRAIFGTLTHAHIHHSSLLRYQIR